MIDNERRMTDLERYSSMRKVLAERPVFDNMEDAKTNMRAKEGEFRRFVVRGALGSYTVCYCFIQTNREGVQRWGHNTDYTFSHGQMNTCRDRAALAIGRELVESM